MTKIGEGFDTKGGVEGVEYSTSCRDYAVAREGVEEERLAAGDASNKTAIASAVYGHDLLRQPADIVTKRLKALATRP